MNKFCILFAITFFHLYTADFDTAVKSYFCVNKAQIAKLFEHVSAHDSYKMVAFIEVQLRTNTSFSDAEKKELLLMQKAIVTEGAGFGGLSTRPASPGDRLLAQRGMFGFGALTEPSILLECVDQTFSSHINVLQGFIDKGRAAQRASFDASQIDYVTSIYSESSDRDVGVALLNMYKQLQGVWDMGNIQRLIAAIPLDDPDKGVTDKLSYAIFLEHLLERLNKEGEKQVLLPLVKKMIDSIHTGAENAARDGDGTLLKKLRVRDPQIKSAEDALIRFASTSGARSAQRALGAVKFTPALLKVLINKKHDLSYKKASGLKVNNSFSVGSTFQTVAEKYLEELVSGVSRLSSASSLIQILEEVSGTNYMQYAVLNFDGSENVKYEFVGQQFFHVAFVQWLSEVADGCAEPRGFFGLNNAFFFNPFTVKADWNEKTLDSVKTVIPGDVHNNMQRIIDAVIEAHTLDCKVFSGILRTGRGDDAGHYHTLAVDLDKKRVNIINPGQHMDDESNRMTFTEMVRVLSEALQSARVINGPLKLNILGTSQQTGNGACGLVATLVAKQIASSGNIDDHRLPKSGSDIEQGFFKSVADFGQILDLSAMVE